MEKIRVINNETFSDSSLTSGFDVYVLLAWMYFGEMLFIAYKFYLFLLVQFWLVDQDPREFKWDQICTMHNPTRVSPELNEISGLCVRNFENLNPTGLHLNMISSRGWMMRKHLLGPNC